MTAEKYLGDLLSQNCIRLSASFAYKIVSDGSTQIKSIMSNEPIVYSKHTKK